MHKTTLIGTVLEQSPSMIVMQEGEAVARYSKVYYRLPNDQDKAGEPVAIVWTNQLPVKMTCGIHGILAPAYS